MHEPSRARSAMRLAGVFALAFLSLAVAAYAVGVYGFLPLGALVDPEMRANFEAHRAAIYTHVFASSVALAVGPWQFAAGLRSRHRAVHRWLGRAYLGIGVLCGGAAGLFMAFHAFGGLPARAGFAALAAAWLYTGWRAYRAIRAQDPRAHRRWMVRNFALTFAAVTLRLWLPASLAAGVPATVGYPIVAWLCWVPNLLAAQWWLNKASRASIERAPPGAAGVSAHLGP